MYCESLSDVLIMPVGPAVGTKLRLEVHVGAFSDPVLGGADIIQYSHNAGLEMNIFV